MTMRLTAMRRLMIVLGPVSPAQTIYLRDDQEGDGKSFLLAWRSILSIHFPVAPVCLALAAAAITASSRTAAAGVNLLRIQDSFDSTSHATCRSAMLGLVAITAVSCDNMVESQSLYDTGHFSEWVGNYMGPGRI